MENYDQENKEGNVPEEDSKVQEIREKWSAKTGKIKYYREDYAQTAFQIAQTGCTEYELARYMGVHPTTIDRWKNEHPEFKQAIKDAKLVADSKVQRALYERACGYTHKELQTMEGIDGKGEPYSYTKTIERHVPPDVKAIIFWLTNRQKEHWMDVRKNESRLEYKFSLQKAKEIDMEGLDDNVKKVIRSIVVKSMSDAEILESDDKKR